MGLAFVLGLFLIVCFTEVDVARKLNTESHMKKKDNIYFSDFQDMLRSVAKILKRKAFRTNVYQVTYNLYLHPNSSMYWFIRITAPYARLFIGPIETLQYFEIVILDKATDCTFEIAIIL